MELAHTIEIPSDEKAGEKVVDLCLPQEDEWRTNRESKEHRSKNQASDSAVKGFFAMVSGRKARV